MSYCTYEVDREKRIARLTFNRPEKLNVIRTPDDQEEMIARLEEAEMDDKVAVIILSGAGKGFGGGYDLTAVRGRRGFDKEGTRPNQRTRLQRVREEWWGKRAILQKILSCDKVTIAQVHGYCYGGHLEVMCACDLAFASEDALFTHPGYSYLGVEGPIQLYVLMMGWRRVKEMMLLAEPITAKEAREMGMITRVFPKEKLEEETLRLATRIAKRPLDSMVLGKAEFDLALDAMGMGFGYNLASFAHALSSNLQFEEGEFNLMKEIRDKGLQGMYKARDEYYKDTPMRK